MSLHAESILVSAGRPSGAGTPLNQPVELVAPFRGAGAQNHYLRNDSSETVRCYERAVAAVESPTEPAEAVAFATGMAAIAAVVESLPTGSVAVVPTVGYSGTTMLFAEQEALGRLRVRRVDITDADAVLGALDGADLLWLETVTNPLIGVADLPVLIDAARAGGTLVGVDATFSTPLVVRPLDLRADLVMHSATKYLAGHSDLQSGVVVTRQPMHAERLRTRRRLAGAMPGALDCYLALRGLRTLALRMERAQATAAELARRLDAHAQVTRVRFPGLPTDPGHAIAVRLHAGFGAVLSFEVAGGAAAADRVCGAVRLITHATSLGGVETLIERRAQYAVDAAAGTPESLLRLAVGIEHVDDLWADLAQALDAR